MANYHFVGLAGIGMSGLAQLARARGDTVTGSDRFFDRGEMPDRRARLEAQGVRVFPQDGSAIHRDITHLVVSTAIEEENADLARARELGLTTIHRSRLLSNFFQECRRGVAVTGSFGKTTITALVGWGLACAGWKPMVVNGGIMRNFESEKLVGNAVPGDGQCGCIEADESDGTCIAYRPSVGIITGAARDHKDLEELQRIYGTFAANTHDALVLSPQVGAMLFGLPGPKRVTFGLRDGDVRPRRVHFGSRDIRFNVGDMRFTVRQIGAYSVFNALAAIAALREMGVSDHSIEASLRSFEGVARRMELINRVRGVRIFDDFAHNPSKIEAALDAVRRAGAKRVFGVFQLHGYGPARFMRQELAEVFARCLTKEDRLYMLPIYYAGGTAAKDVSAADIAAEAASRGAPVHAVADRAELLALLREHAQEKDTILVMGARDDTLTGLCKEIGTALESAPPRAG